MCERSWGTTHGGNTCVAVRLTVLSLMVVACGPTRDETKCTPACENRAGCDGFEDVPSCISFCASQLEDEYDRSYACGVRYEEYLTCAAAAEIDCLDVSRPAGVGPSPLALWAIGCDERLAA